MITPATGLIITGAALVFLLVFLLLLALNAGGRAAGPDRAAVEYCGFLMATEHTHCYCGQHR